MSTRIEMENLLAYILQASIGILLFYLLYLLLLKKETFYQLNRFFLVAGLVLAMLLPLFPISYESPISMGSNSEFFSYSEKPMAEGIKNTTTAQEETGFLTSISQFLKLIYLTGVIFFLSRLIGQTASIFSRMRKSKYTIIDDIKVIHQKTTMPFSFFNVVFIDIQMYSDRELSNIIAHEKVHIQERHWIDLLIIELLTVLFWVNPVVWLYERSIKQNHEYLADRGVLLAGYSPGSYQALLINQLMGVKVLGFAHNLNFSLNKKRMEMMKKEKSPGVSKMKLLLVLPAIALLVFAFAKKEYVMEESALTPANSHSSNVNQNTNQLNENNLIKIEGMVTNSNGLPLTGANVFIKNTSTGTVVDEQGEFELLVPKIDKELTGRIGENGKETIENANVIVISYVGYSTLEIAFDSREDRKFENIRLTKSVYDIVLPEIGDGETLINGEAREVPPPPPPPKKRRNDEVFEVVEEMPYYSRSGIYGLAMDIKKEAGSIMKGTNDRGFAVVGFMLTADGDVTNCQIVESSDSKLLDESAIKIVTKLDNWNPGIQQGKRVPVNLTVPVRFN
jgi:TonB family protein